MYLRHASRLCRMWEATVHSAPFTRSNSRQGLAMKLASRLASAAAIVLLVAAAVQSPVQARSSTNIGHGTTCYNVPTTNPDGSITWTRVCFKRA